MAFQRRPGSSGVPTLIARIMRRTRCVSPSQGLRTGLVDLRGPL